MALLFPHPRNAEPLRQLHATACTTAPSSTRPIRRTVREIEFAFPAGCTWLCYTDQVMHAALSGQYVLEQTFHLDLEAMTYPARSPFNVLERMTGRALTPNPPQTEAPGVTQV